jgi:hypothetical protein
MSKKKVSLPRVYFATQTIVADSERKIESIEEGRPLEGTYKVYPNTESLFSLLKKAPQEVREKTYLVEVQLPNENVLVGPLTTQGSHLKAKSGAIVLSVAPLSLYVAKGIEEKVLQAD